MNEFSHVAPEPEFVHVVVQDHGPGDGGWGPATVMHPNRPWPFPLMTTRTNAETLEWMRTMARKVALETGKPTKLVRFKIDQVVDSWAGSS